jgi:IS5 family transposase
MKNKTRYRIKNWREYNQSLINRGDLTLWIDDSTLLNWHQNSLSGKRGASLTYSDRAIECMLLLKSVFKLPLRAVQGFAKSLLKLMSVEVKIPHYSTICRRQQDLSVTLNARKSKAPRDIVIDSTGLKVYGEGEWKVRKHGISKRRTWRKVHLAIDAGSHDLLACVATTNDVGDAEVLDSLLEQTDGQVNSVAADGAYDTRKAYDLIRQLNAKALIPPRKGAKIWQHGNSKKERHNRDENLRYARQHGMKKWKVDSGYHQRSLSETAMYRLKQLMGSELSSRTFSRQAVEIFVRCKAINIMTELGMPETYAVD